VERLELRLVQNYSPPVHPHALVRALNDQEHAAATTEAIEVRRDEYAMERLRRKGRVIAAQVIAVQQPKKGCYPCSLVFETDQSVLRIRRETRLEFIGGRVKGEVTVVSETKSGRTRFEFKILEGVRSRPEVGAAVELTDAILGEAPFGKNKIFARMKQDKPSLAYDSQLPPSKPRQVTTQMSRPILPRSGGQQ
jgi:hypothetical protein